MIAVDSSVLDPWRRSGPSRLPARHDALGSDGGRGLRGRGAEVQTMLDTRDTVMRADRIRHPFEPVESKLALHAGSMQRQRQRGGEAPDFDFVGPRTAAGDALITFDAEFHRRLLKGSKLIVPGTDAST